MEIELNYGVTDGKAPMEIITDLDEVLLFMEEGYKLAEDNEEELYLVKGEDKIWLRLHKFSRRELTNKYKIKKIK